MRWFAVLFIPLLFGCHTASTEVNQDAFLFKMLSAEESGISHFYGALPHATLEGGGVGVGDFNLDGLQDVFLVGDSLHGLYENKGDLKFEDRIKTSSIPAIRGVGPVVVYDINKDQLPDIIIGRRDITNNPLQKIINGDLNLESLESNLIIYINEGDFVFSKSDDYKIDIQDAVGGISLADFDKNGLLDLAISSWNVDMEMFDGVILDFEKDFKKDSICTVQLYMQIAPGNFVENCLNAGLTKGGKVRTSFSNIATDFNDDGHIDLIVTNDFDFPDQWYLNNGNGEFRRLENEIKNKPFFAMGIDAADINNDGLLDVCITDMRPEGYYRQKTVKYDKFFNWETNDTKGDITSQQVRNHLYVNQSELAFSEIAELTGVDATEWSWAVLMTDFDNNEQKDIFIGNGYFLQDLMNQDSPLYIDSLSKHSESENLGVQLFGDNVTKEYYKNYFYSNEGSLKFKNASNEWFMDLALNTRGAAYADLDNDGDLDLIFNNAKQQSCILQNRTNERDSLNYLRVQLNTQDFETLHSKCYIYYGEEKQLLEFNPVRGFYSNSEPILHFGLGKTEQVDSLVVLWVNGLTTVIHNPPINSALTVSPENKTTNQTRTKLAKGSPFSREDFGINYTHQENEYNDFKQNLLLPQIYSKFGPNIAAGDLDGNGLEDFVIGGALGTSATIYYQQSLEQFVKDESALNKELDYEDAGIEILDINQDGRNDIFIAAGGNEASAENAMYTHRYYLNLGKGKFSMHEVPNIKSSASVVKQIEINEKSYLIVAGRLSAWQYPLTPKTHVLSYQNNEFIDLSQTIAPSLVDIGMVTDFICTDFNQDGLQDLIVVGEYMKPRFLQNTNTGLEEIEFLDHQENLTGRWNCLVEGDFNGDGLPDYILGNDGLNTRYKVGKNEPLEIFANDFDDNGSLDVISAYYEEGKLYPTKHLHTFKARINGFSKTYYKASHFANTTIPNMFPSTLLEDGFHAEARTLSSCCLMSNIENGYSLVNLPMWAQVSPVMSMAVFDYNFDGFDDVVIAGNFYHSEIERGIYDAHKGLILEGSKDGHFKEVLPNKSGLWLQGEIRSLLIINRDKSPIIVGLENNGKAVSYKLNKY